MYGNPLSHDFEDIRASLRGMLTARVYAEYYRIARYECRASILELGTGQGAGTVAFALGLRDSGRPARVIAIDQFSQHAQGPHPASRKTHGNDTVALNLRAFEKGLRKYGVHERFEALDLLSKERVIGSTVFCRKTSEASFLDRWTAADGDAIEQWIVDDFVSLLRERNDAGDHGALSVSLRLRRRLMRWLYHNRNN